MTVSDDIKATLESETAKKRFNMNSVFRSVVDSGSVLEPLSRYPGIQAALGERTASHVLKGVLRATFLIELVKLPKVETTKFEVRWTQRLDRTDPRHADFDECLLILDRLMTDLEEATHSEDNRELLKLFQARNLLPYEIPLDYLERRLEGRFHCSDNMSWAFDDLPRRVLKLRSFLLDPDLNPHVDLFSDVYEKIKVKTYLTDRVLTGDHKTNREKRWETHPASVHFALRRTCLEIEHTLLIQLCRFQGFPDDLAGKLEGAALIPSPDVPFRCPITMEPLSFAQLEREVLDPEHGKASFQVGHLNPLKAVSDDPHSGHTADNISWISSDGNRIQGHLSLEDTHDMIRRIYANYEQFGAS